MRAGPPLPPCSCPNPAHEKGILLPLATQEDGLCDPCRIVCMGTAIYPGDWRLEVGKGTWTFTSGGAGSGLQQYNETLVDNTIIDDDLGK